MGGNVHDNEFMITMSECELEEHQKLTLLNFKDSDWEEEEESRGEHL